MNTSLTDHEWCHDCHLVPQLLCCDVHNELWIKVKLFQKEIITCQQWHVAISCGVSDMWPIEHCSWWRGQGGVNKPARLNKITTNTEMAMLSREVEKYWRPPVEDDDHNSYNCQQTWNMALFSPLKETHTIWTGGRRCEASKFTAKWARNTVTNWYKYSEKWIWVLLSSTKFPHNFTLIAKGGWAANANARINKYSWKMWEIIVKKTGGAERKNWRCPSGSCSIATNARMKVLSERKLLSIPGLFQ